MERFSFNEIKNFKTGDKFSVASKEYTVSWQPLYRSESNFYFEFSESLEWFAVSTENNHEIKFHVSNTREKNNATNPIIFKPRS